MKPKPLPDYTTLRSMFTYDPETGIVLRNWKVPKKVGFSQGISRHLCVCINYEMFYLHRVIWCLVTGNDPGNLIVDHKDGNTHNNKWDNLRLVTKTINNKNQAKRKHKFGYDGVSKLGNKYRAYVKDSGKYKHIGMFDTSDAAIAAVKAEHIRIAKETNDSVLLEKATR